MILTCNKCNYKLTEARGCVFCSDFKSTFLTIKEEQVGVKALVVANNALGLAASDMERIIRWSNNTEEYDPALGSEIQKNTVTITKLLDTIRKFKEEASDEEELTPSEKRAMFIEWLHSLPIMLRRETLRIVMKSFDVDIAVVAGLQ